MKRILALIVTAVFWAAPVSAQMPVPPPQGDAPAPAAESRGTAFDTMVAFAGVALTLLVVCYPARRN